MTSVPRITHRLRKGPGGGGNNSQIELNTYGDLRNADIILDDTQRRDAPQGAEVLHMNNVMKDLYGTECKNAEQNKCYVKSHFSPYVTWCTEFHIEINGEVKLGYPLNIDDFEGEVKKYLPSFICT